MSEAQHKSQGLVAISLMIQVSEFFIERSRALDTKVFVHFSHCFHPRQLPRVINYSRLILYTINKDVIRSRRSKGFAIINIIYNVRERERERACKRKECLRIHLRHPCRSDSMFNPPNEARKLIIMLAVNTSVVSHPTTLVKPPCYSEARS